MDIAPAPTLVASLRTQLRAHAPFAQMSEADLDHLILKAPLAYFAPGERLLAPADGPAQTCFILRQGRVHGSRPAAPGMEQTTTELSPGDMFPIGALLAKRPVMSEYHAVDDVFALCLPGVLFDRLVREDPAFGDFCTRRIAHLLELSRSELQASYVAEATSLQAMDRPLRELVRRAPVTCEIETPLRTALITMQTAGVGAIVITDPHHRPLGIFTRGDLVAKVVLPNRDLDTPIFQVMSHPVHQLAIDAPAGDAALALAQHGIQHLPLVENGRLAGVVSERDLFGLQRQSLREVSRGIRLADSIDALALAARDIRALTHGLVAQGVGAARLTRFISSLNDQLTQQLLTLVAKTHPLDGIQWCWLALGSEGRHEQTISTDQDNGLIFDTDGDPAVARTRLLAFARAANLALQSCGFPLCKGEIMASNPRWCLTADEWRQRFTGWIERGDPEALLRANIFFDFRPLAGDSGLAYALRHAIGGGAQRNTRFLTLLAHNVLQTRPPLNWLGRLAEDREGSIDLKRQGSMPFVDAARVMALAAGVAATSTQERLLQATPALRLTPASVQAWIDAFHFIQLLRLRVQHDAGATQPNRLDPDRLSAIDQRILREAFRQARKLQQQLQMLFPA